MKLKMIKRLPIFFYFVVGTNKQKRKRNSVKIQFSKYLTNGEEKRIGWNLNNLAKIGSV